MNVKKRKQLFWLPTKKSNSDDYLRMSKCLIQGRVESSRLRSAAIRKADVIQYNSLYLLIMNQVSLEKKSISIYAFFYT